MTKYSYSDTDIFPFQQLGTILCLSTMAAAALGNLISDCAGVGLAHYVEILVHKAGIKHPVLTLEQLESRKVLVHSQTSAYSIV